MSDPRAPALINRCTGSGQVPSRIEFHKTYTECGMGACFVCGEVVPLDEFDRAEIHLQRKAEPMSDQYDNDDLLYLNLLGARERLCRAEVSVSAQWKDELSKAVQIIDRVGSSVVPNQWSRFDHSHDLPTRNEADR